jgi:hypothetical protein
MKNLRTILLLLLYVTCTSELSACIRFTENYLSLFSQLLFN